MQPTDLQSANPHDAVKGARHVADEAGAGLSRLTESAQQTMERFANAASHTASRLTAQGEELLKGPAARKARTYMREHPVAAVGIAMAVGLVLSKLLSKR